MPGLDICKYSWFDRPSNPMKLLHQDRRTGEIKLYLESLDDLWHLKNLVEPNDLVWGDTYRRGEEQSDKLRTERAEKRRMRLGVRVEKIEYQENQDKIRILGRIEAGPQDIGHHHALMLGAGDDVSIFKEEWKRHELERIRSAIDQSMRPSIYFVVLDDTDANVFVMSQFSVKEIGSISRTGTGKMYESKTDKQSYFAEIIQILTATIKNEPIIVLGPGFAKEALITYMKEKHPELAARMTSAVSSQTGAAGVYEIIKKGLGGKVLDLSRISVETKLIEEVLTRIKMNQPVAYGPKQVALAVDSGAVETLLLTEKEARTRQGETFMRMTEENSGKVEIMSDTHDSGKQLESLGGYAALLRYNIDV
jgi:protein pelota